MSVPGRVWRSVRRMSSGVPNYKEAHKLLNPKTTIAKIDSIKPLANEDSRFIKLQGIEYTTPLGKKSKWEMAKRSTRPETSEIDAVIIIPILKYENNEKELVFVRQFRPPCNGVMVEFPAGLVDPNDSVESCAIRELKEETGYVGKIVKKSVTVWSDPGLADANCCIIWMEVDMSLPENKEPVPHWMDEEVIEVVTVKMDNLDDTLNTWSEEGYLIDAKVQTLVFGMSLK